MKKSEIAYEIAKGTAQIGAEIYAAQIVMPVIEQVSDAVLPGSGKAIKVVKFIGNTVVGAGITYYTGQYVGILFDECKAMADATKMYIDVRKEIKKSEKKTKTTKKTKKTK